MRLERLYIDCFRNISSMEITPSPGVNVIYGDNAQGKTNLIEAIYLLTGQKSFRQAKDSDYILFGQQQARLEADFFAGNRSQNVVMTIGTKKTAQLGELSVPPSELTGRFFAVVFSPAELSLVQDGPAMRRSFLDSAISQVMPRYIKTLAAMNRSLFQRNSLLGDVRGHSGMEDMLDSWDRSFARLAFSVINARRRYIARLAPRTGEIYGKISSGKEKLETTYQSSLRLDWDGLTPQQGEEAIAAQLRKNRAEDIKNGFTTLGPQRDDLELLVNGSSARSFGSQGQQRSCALALKLAECALIEEICGEQPIVLLDDVLSELDKSRREFFIKGFDGGQIFITSCDSAGLRKLPVGSKLRIKDGALATPSRKRQVKEHVSPSGTGNGG